MLYVLKTLKKEKVQGWTDHYSMQSFRLPKIKIVAELDT